MPNLNFVGKNKVVNHHRQVSFRFLEKQYGSSENMIIHGDNLLALRSLLATHRGKIKCIYIDPPYNTGNENWIYNDNVNDPEIKTWIGKVVGDEETDLNRHDKWLCMMYPRLRLLHELLSDDGAIFISIDDNEVANLKLICGEIFGTQNFIACIANVNKPSGRSDSKYIAGAHEYVLFYRKSPALVTHGFAPEEKVTSRYNRIDSEGKKWREIDLRKTGSNDLRTDRPNMFYPFYWNEESKTLSLEMTLGAREIFPMVSAEIEGCWRWEKSTSQKNISRLYARYMPNKKQWSVFEMDYFDPNDTVKPVSAWTFKDCNSELGTELLVKKLGFKKTDFPYSKPVGLIKRILTIATDPDSIILDAFAGSGTTAQSVIELNREDQGSRKFILIESMDYCESITAERVRRVNGDFSFYELGDPIFIDDQLNPNLSRDQFRRYLFYSETKKEIPSMNPDEPTLLGIHDGIAYHLIDSTLDFNSLNQIKTRSNGYVIFAESCIISQETRDQFKIYFRKIPRDIRRI